MGGRRLSGLVGGARELLAGREGQGTTEYAILVGVLVITNTTHWR